MILMQLQLQLIETLGNQTKSLVHTSLFFGLVQSSCQSIAPDFQTLPTTEVTLLFYSSFSFWLLGIGRGNPGVFWVLPLPLPSKTLTTRVRVYGGYKDSYPYPYPHIPLTKPLGVYPCHSLIYHYLIR